MRADFDSKITEVENKIPDISGLASKSELTTVENEIPDISGLVTKTNYNTKISEIEGKINNHIHDQYVTTTTLNALSTNLVTKTKFDAELKKASDRVTSNKRKDLLLENEIKILEKFAAAYFRSKIYFDNDGTQNYLVFQPVYKYFELNSGKVSSWESKGLFNEKLLWSLFLLYLKLIIYQKYSIIMIE